VTEPATLASRYTQDDLRILTEDERRHIDETALPWELLYRKEPELYARLIAGERVHPKVLDWLPPAKRCVEVAAGSGRLTLDIAARYDELIAVEPAGPLRRLLEDALREHGLVGVRTENGFFDDLPVSDGWADVVVSLSAFTARSGGDAGLTEMERVAAPGGLLVLVWPSDVPWLEARGFEYVSFPGEMFVEFASVDEAVELARIFYPHATGEIARRARSRVPYEVLGMNPPRDLAWKRT
jgi:SAM-dependent methyltransferase